MGEYYLAAQIEQVVFLALDVAHRQLGVIRLRVDVDHQFDGIAEGRLLAGDYGVFSVLTGVTTSLMSPL